MIIFAQVNLSKSVTIKTLIIMAFNATLNFSGKEFDVLEASCKLN